MPGALWLLAAEIETNATATVRIIVTPTDGSEMEVLYGRIRNNGAGARVVGVNLRDEDDEVYANLLNVGYSLGNGASVPFPAKAADLADDIANPVGPRYIIASNMDLLFFMDGALTTEEMDIELVARITGDKPGVAFTSSAGTITSAIRMSEVY